MALKNTGNDRFSGDRFCGNGRFSGLKPPNDAILFTISGITVIADKEFEDFNKKLEILMQIYNFL